MWRAIDLLRRSRGRPRRGAVEGRQAAFTGYARYLADGGPPAAPRGAPSPPPAGWPELEGEQERLAAQRAFDDPLVMAEYRMTGEAFAGGRPAEPDRCDDSGSRPSPAPDHGRDRGEVTAEPGAGLARPPAQPEGGRRRRRPAGGRAHGRVVP